MVNEKPNEVFDREKKKFVWKCDQNFPKLDYVEPGC